MGETTPWTWIQSVSNVSHSVTEVVEVKRLQVHHHHKVQDRCWVFQTNGPLRSIYSLRYLGLLKEDILYEVCVGYGSVFLSSKETHRRLLIYLE